jgi:predicted DNA-binding transcriptional regulator AlpA
MKKSAAKSWRTSAKGPADRLYRGADIAHALGMSKMTVWRYVKEGRLSLPKRFVQHGPQRLWLWTAEEYKEAVNICRKAFLRPRQGPRVRWLTRRKLR